MYSWRNNIKIWC